MAEPTRRAALLALAARVEQAAEGSRTLDEVISCAIFPELRAVNDGETIWIMHGQLRRRLLGVLRHGIHAQRARIEQPAQQQRLQAHGAHRQGIGQQQEIGRASCRERV